MGQAAFEEVEVGRGRGQRAGGCMSLDLDIGNTLSKWRLKDADSSEIRSRGAVWTREEWRPGADIPDLDVVESVRISSVARQAVLARTVSLLRHRVGGVHVARSTPE